MHSVSPSNITEKYLWLTQHDKLINQKISVQLAEKYVNLDIKRRKNVRTCGTTKSLEDDTNLPKIALKKNVKRNPHRFRLQNELREI